jgi:hypothetical protein
MLPGVLRILRNIIADNVQVKKVEDVVYDLSLRDLLPKTN